MKEMIDASVICKVWKAAAVAVGSGVGWIVGEFEPTFPLIIVMVCFIFYDAWTAYQLDRRVKRAYPDKARRPAKFTSFAFGKVVRKTIPERLVLILLAFMAEKWVFVHVSIPLSYIVTGAILFEQAWSSLENNSSCRSETESRFWRMLQRIMIDKTERHFDVDLGEMKEGGRVTDEQIESARQLLAEFERYKNGQKDEDTH